MNEKERPLEPKQGNKVYYVNVEEHKSTTYVVYADTYEQAENYVNEGFYDDIDDEDSVKEIVSICEII